MFGEHMKNVTEHLSNMGVRTVATNAWHHPALYRGSTINQVLSLYQYNNNNNNLAPFRNPGTQGLT